MILIVSERTSIILVDYVPTGCSNFSLVRTDDWSATSHLLRSLDRLVVCRQLCMRFARCSRLRPPQEAVGSYTAVIVLLFTVNFWKLHFQFTIYVVMHSKFIVQISKLTLLPFPPRQGLLLFALHCWHSSMRLKGQFAVTLLLIAIAQCGTPVSGTRYAGRTQRSLLARTLAAAPIDTGLQDPTVNGTVPNGHYLNGDGLWASTVYAPPQLGGTKPFSAGAWGQVLDQSS